MRALESDRGLKVLFRPMKSHIVDLSYFVNLGAIEEKPENEGYCHALEHMLFAGTQNRDWEQINRDWEKIGADSNAWTGHDKTHYSANCMRSVWEESLEVLMDILHNPTFPEERWEEIEKPVIISEIQGEQDDADHELETETYRHALGEDYHPIMGSIESIKRATIEDLKLFYNNYYRGDNLVLAIAGDLTEEQVLRAVNRFDNSNRERPHRKRRPKFKFINKTLTLKKHLLEQEYLMLLKPVFVPKTRKGKMALDIAVACFSQYLFEELREKRGLCYWVSASIYDELRAGKSYYLKIRAATDVERFKKLERTVRDCVKNFKQAFDSQRIRNMIMAGKYETLVASERTDEATALMWESWLEGTIEGDPYKNQLDILDDLNDSYIRRVASRAFQGDMKFGKTIGK
ncbi:MAG: hypothetical protein GF334_04805 [Candidatus Altiarchaeales archaeon]|nr:hypothetical protein [Candidatus Altiarchaeales archaeon]